MPRPRSTAAWLLRTISAILGKVDAVSVAVPTELHARIGQDLLDHGVNVLVEKPITRTLEEADSLVAAQARTGRILRVGHVERFNPAVQAVLPFRTTPRFFESHRLGIFSPRSLDIDVVLDLMVHDLDLVLRLTRSPVVDIKAVGIPILTPRIDIANARLEFEDGCVANMTASRVSKDKVRKLRFFQPSDYISIDFFKQEVEMYSLVQKTPRPEILERVLPVTKEEPLKLELLSFLRAVRGESTPEDAFSGVYRRTGDRGSRPGDEDPPRDAQAVSSPSRLPDKRELPECGKGVRPTMRLSGEGQRRLS